MPEPREEPPAYEKSIAEKATPIEAVEDASLGAAASDGATSDCECAQKVWLSEVIFNFVVA